MLNVYQFHNNPEKLHGLHTHNKTQFLIGYDAAKLLAEKQFGEHSKEDLLAKVLSNPESCYEYATFIDKPFPKGEPVIARDAMSSTVYAMDILGGRFQLGEKAISQDAICSVRYAMDVLGVPFKMGEPAIKKDKIALDEYNEFLEENGYEPI